MEKLGLLRETELLRQSQVEECLQSLAKTEYTVEVAAETSAGIGVYSPQTSSNSEYTYTFQEMMGNRCILILFRCISQSEWCHYS